MTEPAVISNTVAGVTTLTLNRPEQRNSLSAELVDGLGSSLQKAIDDEQVRAVVLTNRGNTFCAGADLKNQSTSKPLFSLVDLFELMQSAPKPIVGAIAGHCMGGGVGLAAACDISVVANDALLGFTEVRLGVAPAIISVVCLPKMRAADAMELFLSGERISASRAQEVGLINHVAEPDSLQSKVDEITDKLVRGGPLAVAAAKNLVMKVPAASRQEAFSWTAKLSADLFQSAEAKEGIAAFRERRDASWVPKA